MCFRPTTGARAVKCPQCGAFNKPTVPKCQKCGYSSEEAAADHKKPKEEKSE